MKLFIYDKFWESFMNLPKNTQKKVLDFKKKFRENPKSSAINLESISTFIDKSFRSARVDQKYRIILSDTGKDEVYYLLWVDNHDEAYEWGRNKTFQWNENTHVAQVFEVPDAEETKKIVDKKVKVSTTFFEGIGKEKLSSLGVPKILLPIVLPVNDLNGLEALQSYLPEEVFENLFYLMDGANLDVLITEVQAGKSESKTYENQQVSPNNQRSFIEFNDEDTFREMIMGDLKKWIFYLHPDQRKLVVNDFNGAVKVTGGAGTGKTVVALHRLKYITNTYSDSNVLFVTYTKSLTRNLQGLTDSLKIDSSKFHITNLDDFAIKKARELNLIKTDTKIIEISSVINKNDLWDQVIEGTTIKWDRDFISAEYEKVVLFNNIKERQAYFEVLRKGRGSALSRRDRKELWDIFIIYNEKKASKNLIDRSELFNILCDHITELESKPFTNIIVDELQDFSNVELRLIRSLAPEGKNDLFMVGDPLQSIYDKKIVFSQCGIKVKGKRSVRLRINYRTSEEIRKKAVSIIIDEVYDDFDGEQEDKKGYRSLFRGKDPEYKLFKSKQDEIDEVFNYVHNLVNDSKFSYSDIVIAGRRKDDLKEFKTKFHREDIPSYDLKTSSGDANGVHFSTIHSLKGLEFKHVILIGINNQTFPLRFANYNNLSDQDLINYKKLEKSLMYVAMTRAVHSVLITGTGEGSKLL